MHRCVCGKALTGMRCTHCGASHWTPTTPTGKRAYDSAQVFWPDATWDVTHVDNLQGKCHAALCALPAIKGSDYCAIHTSREDAQRERIQRTRVVEARRREARKTAKTLPRATFRRPPEVHERLQYIVDAMNETRYYGNEAHQLTLAMLERENAKINRDILRGKIGFDAPRLARDMEDIAKRSLGKVMATRLKMAEREQQRDAGERTQRSPGEKTPPKQGRTLSLDDIRTARGK